MTKRNFILLIIILVIITAVVYGFILFRKSTPDGLNPGTGTNFVSEFNPFGDSTPNGSTDLPTTTENPNQGGEQSGIIEARKLNKVSSIPVAGFTVYQKERYKDVPLIAPAPEEASAPASDSVPTKTTAKIVVKPTPPPTEFVPALRYVARATGNTFQTFADKLEERQFTSSVIPKIHESLWGARAESVVMRYLKTDDTTIATFTGSLPKEILGGDTSSDTRINGGFLTENITDLSVSPDGAKIFYLFNTNGNATGITAGILGDKKVQVFTSPFTEWLSQWPNSKMITLTTKPSYTVPGYMYAINPDKKDFVRILGNITGLTTNTSPDGKLVLFANSALDLNIYNISTGETVSLPTRTMPEKCVWNNTSTSIYCSVPIAIGGASYPDDWYRGEVSFTDQIWKLDVETGSGSILIDPTTLPEGYLMDGIKLALDEGENYLFFVNKKDSALWELELN